MRHQRTCRLPAKLDAARQQFDQWRSQNPPRTHLPQSLWAVAAELAGEFGLNQTARTLRLNYYGLKKRLDSSACSEPPPARVTQSFLELLPIPVNPENPNTECMIECKDASGMHIRIQLKEVHVPDLAKLCGELWRSGR
jgi:hypothetical protein